MPLPSVTVHVTVKNARDTIKKCVDSLLKVDYPNKEIIVTDAYSTDGTYEILKKYGKKIKLERVKGNAPTAHNHVIKKINSDFIALTDADCVVDKNWLKYLISAFKSKDIVASGGFCKTPSNVNSLQKIIGEELESRFLHFPKFVSRLPTMNLCVRTNAAKKVKFDERFDVAFETDFGYRLTKLGKMVYEPKAVIWHYHRPTLKSFFKQQMKYGKFTPLLYFKHPGKSTGDKISKPSMILQEFIFLFTILFAILSIVELSLISIAANLFLILILYYIIEILSITKKIKEIPVFVLLYLTRTAAWSIGLVSGLFSLVRK